MLTTQESLEAMAGRSADGAPLVFVAARDFHSLREKHEALLRSLEKTPKPLKRWQAVLVATIPSAFVGVPSLYLGRQVACVGCFAAGLIFMQAYAVWRGRG